jgi:murein DD-endopeptidase
MVSLSIDPPPSRPGQHQGGGLKRAALLVAFVVAIGGGFALGRYTAPSRHASDAEAQAPAQGGAAPGTSATASAAEAGAGGAGTAGPSAAAPATPAPQAAAPAAPAPTPAPAAGPRRVIATVTGALEDSIGAALPREDRALAEQLTQVVNRLLVWELQVARDGRRGDRLELVYSPPPAAAPGVPASAEPVVEAVRYASQKLGRTVSAYRYQPSGARWAHYYRPDGSELEERLEGAPLTDYDQVTSLLRDGRRHKGVDFRTPVGSPVLATFDGVVERRNWNFAGNGNCLDIRDPATGRHAIFLHLEVLPKDMAVGRKVRKGEQIALSGNSGHSFAPHLHYQLEASDGRILDPFTVHKVKRLALEAGQRTGFDSRRAELDATLAGGVAAAAPRAPPAPSPSPAVPAALPAAR